MMRMMIVTAVLLSESGFLLVANWSLCNLWLLQHLDGCIWCVNKQKVPRLTLVTTKFPEQRKTGLQVGSPRVWLLSKDQHGIRWTLHVCVVMEELLNRLGPFALARLC